MIVFVVSVRDLRCAVVVRHAAAHRRSVVAHINVRGIVMRAGVAVLVVHTIALGMRVAVLSYIVLHMRVGRIFARMILRLGTRR